MNRAERIAFGRWGSAENRGSPPEIWTANADGTDPRPVGDQRGWYMEWSPDRSHLLFDFVDEDGNEQIGRVNPDGGGFAQLTAGEGFYADPAYSPDGTTIAYTYSPVPEADPDFDMHIWMMNADGTDSRALLAPDAVSEDWEPVFSPDGSRIVFTRDVDKDGSLVSAIHIANADGTGLRQLTPFGDYLEHPRWSPDGTTIIYNVQAQSGDGLDAPHNGIWTVSAEGGDPLQLLPTSDRLHAFKPSYAPDGAHILFGCAHLPGLNEDVCVMNADGTEVRIVIETPEYENFPVWY